MARSLQRSKAPEVLLSKKIVSQMSQIKQGAILSYFNLGLNVLIGLVYTPWMISSIGKADNGLYTLAKSIIGLLAFDFGLGNATTKFICEYLAHDRQDKVNALLGLVFKLYLALDALIFLVFMGVYIFLPDIYEGLTVSEMGAFKVVFIIAACYCILSFPFIPLNGILTGYEKFVQLKSCDLFQRIFIVITMAICLIYGYGLYALVIVNSAAGIITIALKLLVIKSKTPLKVNIRFWDNAELKRIFGFVIWVTVIALSQRMIFNIAPSILGIFADSAQIAVLGVAITIEGYTYLFANAISGMFLPRVSKMVAGKDVSAVQKLMVRVGRLQLFICGFIFIWFAVFGREFINLWVGPGYSAVYLCTLLFLIPIVIQLPQEIGITYIIAANKVRTQSYIYIGMAAINLVLAIPLSKFYGVTGLAVAIFTAFSYRTIALDLMFHKRMGLNMIVFFRDTFGRLLLPFALTTIIMILSNLIPVESWFGLILKSIVATVIFSIVLMTFGANKEEKTLIKSIIFRR